MTTPPMFALMVVLLAAGCTGCSFTHQIKVQEAFVAEEALVPKLAASGPVAVVVASPQTSGPDEFCAAGGRTYTADDKEIAAYTLRSATDILQRNAIPMAKDAEKVLTITALDGTCEFSGALLNFIMQMQVETGSGLRRTVRGNQKMFHVYERDFALSAATLNAVLAMFADEEIQRYLAQ